MTPDFDTKIGDIKAIWELSRFDWVLAFVQKSLNGEVNSFHRLNIWLADWCSHNPPYKGPNWKCGQEASIRVMHLAMATILLDQEKDTSSTLLELIELHLKRIAPTINYAIAQDNNHGTSEAAALYIGGSWLSVHTNQKGPLWHRLGLRWLEDRADRLIGSDGSFSQYSINYHRVLLDTFSMVEVWRQRLGLPRLSNLWYERVRAATEWLHTMINNVNGDGPNLGANDGARLLQLTDTDYRDFRPSVQLAMALFFNARAFPGEGPWNIPLHSLGVAIPERIAPMPSSRVFDDGGFAILRRGETLAMLRYPRFRFRPSHADALHLDFWIGENNIFRDSGTYSYNAAPQWLQYFPGTASHNTVQFDDRDQMPRLSRFLYGDWLKTTAIVPLHEHEDHVSFAAGYRDGYNATHHRCVRLFDNRLTVTDLINGFDTKAILRWRLEPGCWEKTDFQTVRNGSRILTISTSIPVARFELVSGWESRYYLEKTIIPVLEVEVHHPGAITTEYNW